MCSRRRTRRNCAAKYRSERTPRKSVLPTYHYGPQGMVEANPPGKNVSQRNDLYPPFLHKTLGARTLPSPVSQQGGLSSDARSTPTDPRSINPIDDSPPPRYSFEEKRAPMMGMTDKQTVMEKVQSPLNMNGGHLNNPHGYSIAAMHTELRQSFGRSSSW
jgi:hypothetical protein